MTEERYQRAYEIKQKIKELNGAIERVEKTDKIYYKSEDRDGGYTPGEYFEIYKDEASEIKEAIIGYFKEKTNRLNKEFEAL